MTRVAPVVPAETDLLCEACGYTLNGLPEQLNCPECGHPIAASINSTRRPPFWESARGFGNLLRAFVTTSATVIFRPTHFYRTTTTRGDVAAARRFGLVHWWLASILFGVAGALHVGNFGFGVLAPWIVGWTGGVTGGIVLTFVAYGSLLLTTYVANKLTAWEAAYRGIRLPLGVVRRGMYYHAAHYLPVAFVALATIATYRLLRDNQVVSPYSLTPYLYLLCGEVVAAAAYLFHTYWIGMRNMMYANR
jgi:hypothetical protein